MTMIRAILNRYQNRPDSEHAQALVRLVIAVVLLIYLVGLGVGHGFDDIGVTDPIVIMLIEATLGLGLVIAIAIDPGVSHVRRVIGMLGDYGTLAAIMLLQGEALAPLYVILMWVTIGNGLRYGLRYLFVAMGLASATFLAVILGSDYWRGIPYLAWGLLIGLIAIPGYLTSLLRDLRRASDEARRANIAKTRFLANMSHEFRSPLNGIVGMAELLSNTRLSPEQRECSDVIQTSAQAMLLLVEDVLDIAAIEAGKLRRQDSDFNLRDLLRRLRTMLQPQAASKGLSLIIALPQTVPSILIGDASHLSQILHNLLNNAIKFTQIGTVRLDIQVRERGEQGIGLRFSVRDTGSGIAPEDRERIFQAFEQADNSPTRRHGGTGLGTTIAKTLTELLGGRIGVEDNPGGGSHFWVDLDFALSELQPSVEGQLAAKVIAFDDPFVRHRARVRPLRVLVADDQATNRLVLQRLLEQAGHSVVFAENGEEALDEIEAGSLDVAIVDLHMPVLGGLDVIKQARVMQSGGRRTPILALSADVTVDAIREAEAVGAYAFLTKPVVVTRLLETLAEIAGGQEESAAPARGEAVPALRPDVLEELAGMGLGDEFLHDFVQQCLRDSSRCLAQIERAASGGNWEEVREGAHALKGLAENLGAQALAARSTEIMRCMDSVLARQWRGYLSGLSSLLEATAQQVRREMARLTAPGDASSRSPDHESR